MEELCSVYLWPKRELPHCGRITRQPGQSHPYSVNTEDRDMRLDNCSCQFSAVTENFSANEEKPFYTDRCPWWFRR